MIIRFHLILWANPAFFRGDMANNWAARIFFIQILSQNHISTNGSAEGLVGIVSSGIGVGVGVLSVICCILYHNALKA